MKKESKIPLPYNLVKRVLILATINTCFCGPRFTKTKCCFFARAATFSEHNICPDDQWQLRARSIPFPSPWVTLSPGRLARKAVFPAGNLSLVDPSTILISLQCYLLLFSCPCDDDRFSVTSLRSFDDQQINFSSLDPSPGEIARNSSNDGHIGSRKYLNTHDSNACT